eukprot:11713459-Heterocapsa_arctica.AAC.1
MDARRRSRRIGWLGCVRGERRVRWIWALFARCCGHADRLGLLPPGSEYRMPLHQGSQAEGCPARRREAAHLAGSPWAPGSTAH